ncbi:unnamed protein product [Schistocephalus solidus]|uniref:Uncharacterized protein n=1 Tax=Schistocephalus solidus TaxID=70667 RepID=A0A183TQ21_SCHSO|nr:unnamed protein product [Schistocephalus solidus]
MIRKAEEIQGYADRNEMKNFFEAIKAYLRLLHQGDNTTDELWQHNTADIEISNFIALVRALQKLDTNNDLDLPPSLPVTNWAMQQTSSSYAPGSDAIPPEVYKYNGPWLMAELTTLFQEMWRQGLVPHDFKYATIVHLYR